MVKVYTYENADTIANSLAKFITAQQDAVLATKEKFTIAISGGSLISILAKALLKNENIKWSKWVIYFSDERIVPLNDSNSNFGAFEKEVLEPLAHESKVGPTVITINENLVHSHDHTTDAEIAKEYESELPESGIDLVLLGCGPDGHTCSLFPGHKLLQESNLDVASLYDSPKAPPRRITLTLKYLAKCNTLAFVATGASKQTALKEIFEDSTSELPCAKVNALAKTLHGGVCWFVDNAAIDGVNVKKLQY
jgi:6-phosphogluconolactonase